MNFDDIDDFLQVIQRSKEAKKNKESALITEQKEQDDKNVCQDNTCYKTIKVVLKDTKKPIRQTDFAAGYELLSSQDITISPHTTAKIPSGIKMKIPSSYFGWVAGKSSLALKGIMPIGGIIDSDYRGEICVILHNLTNSDYFVEKNKPIAQLILLPYLKSCQLSEVAELPSTQRGEKGFGSNIGY